MVSHWSLSYKYSQVSKVLLSILANLNNVIVWMVSTLSLISKCPSPCTNPLVTLLSEPITIDIIVIFMFHNFFSFLARSKYLSRFFAFFQFYPVISRSGKLHYLAGSLFCWQSQGLFVWPRLRDPFISQNLS